MNGEVHYDLTKRWAAEEGFSPDDAERIAAANWACDSSYITTLRDKRYHWPIFGSPVVALRRFEAAVEAHDLRLLGEGLHALQDTIGHGVLGHFWHWPGIDRLDQRRPAIARRLERWSRRMLAGYRRRVAENTGREDAANA